MRKIYFLLILTTVSSCNFGTNTSEKTIQKSESIELTIKENEDFSKFINQFPTIEFPVVIQGCNENYEHLEETDARSSQLLENDKNYIFGKTILDEKYYLTLTLYDLDGCNMPILTIYNFRGEEVDSKSINIGQCGPGPCGFCKETFILDENLNIYVEDFIINYECDGKDMAILETEQKEILFKEGNIENGKIIISNEKQLKIEKASLNISKNVDENFENFLKYFSTDSIFQINRVDFPLKISESVAEKSYNLYDKIIVLKDYRMWDFTYEESFKTRETSAYFQEIEVENDEAKILRRGNDNGWYVDYIFKKIDGKWMLITWIDAST